MAGDSPFLTTLKLLIIGETGVGKSSLLLRYTNEEFSEEICATIGVDFKTKTAKVDDNNIKLAIWKEHMYPIHRHRTLRSKADNKSRQISKEEGMKFARTHGMLFIEASAKTSEGVDVAFQELILETPGLWESDHIGFKVDQPGQKTPSSWFSWFC